MNIYDLISMLENRLVYTRSQRIAAEQRGDIAQVSALDADLASTQATLDQLRTLL